MPPGHGATVETGPDQLTRLTVVLENPGDAQVLVRARGGDGVGRGGRGVGRGREGGVVK